MGERNSRRRCRPCSGVQRTVIRRVSENEKVWNKMVAYLSPEAVTKSTELLDAVFLFQGLDRVEDDGVNSLLGMGIVTSRAFGHPGHEVKVARSVERDGVAVEGINDQGEVAIGGELISHQLAVLPDADDVGDVEQPDAVVLLISGWSGKVAIVLPSNLDVFAGRRTPAVVAVRARDPGVAAFDRWLTRA